MKEETAIALKALLSSSHPEENYDRFLDEIWAESLQKIPFNRTLDIRDLSSPTRWIEKIHYSWFLPYLESLPPSIQPYFLSLFEKGVRNELKKLLSIEKEREPVLPRFLMTILYEKMAASSFVAPELLPDSDMNILFTLTKKDIILLIDLLGIYDLTYEIRQVVDKTLLNQIYGALREEELSFLHYALKQPVRWSPPKLNIISWDGNTRNLKTLLHYRGLSRLAMSLEEENESFKWYLAHHLDIGRGKVLLKFFAGKGDPAMIPYFKGQVLDIIRRFER